MGKYGLDFISDDDLKKHVIQTLRKYGQGFEEYNLTKFTHNKIDPIKMLFDQSVYNLNWKEWIDAEVYRQRDKTNTNAIGYFHQNIFQYMSGCEVPKKGWDVIYHKQNIEYVPGKYTNVINVEMKNKYNTMNSSSQAKTYMKMQSALMDNDEVCFLVEGIAKQSQNIEWMVSIDGESVPSNKRIRRVSIDQFYKIVTGDENAYYKLCLVLPQVIDDLLKAHTLRLSSDNDILSEIDKIADRKNIDRYLAVCLLSYGTYFGFSSL